MASVVLHAPYVRTLVNYLHTHFSPAMLAAQDRVYQPKKWLCRQAIGTSSYLVCKMSRLLSTAVDKCLVVALDPKENNYFRPSVLVPSEAPT